MTAGAYDLDHSLPARHPDPFFTASATEIDVRFPIPESVAKKPPTPPERTEKPDERPVFRRPPFQVLREDAEDREPERDQGDQRQETPVAEQDQEQKKKGEQNETTGERVGAVPFLEETVLPSHDATPFSYFLYTV